MTSFLDFNLSAMSVELALIDGTPLGPIYAGYRERLLSRQARVGTAEPIEGHDVGQIDATQTDTATTNIATELSESDEITLTILSYLTLMREDLNDLLLGILHEENPLVRLQRAREALDRYYDETKVHEGIADVNLKLLNVLAPRRKVWEPTDAERRSSNMYAFMQAVNEEYRLELDDFEDLHAWSIAEPEKFGETMWRFFNIKASAQPSVVRVKGERMIDTQWFPGAELNYAENVLDQWKDYPGKAIVFMNESGEERSLSGAELYKQVARFAESLKRMGVVRGDKVAGYLPNIPEGVIAMLATSSIGAVWTSVSPEVGARSVIGRFSQVKPKVLITADGQVYRKKASDALGNVKQIAEGVPSIENIVVVPCLAHEEEPDLTVLGDQKSKATHYKDFLIPEEETPGKIDFEQLPFDHPLFVVFTSGTSGEPKCIVHAAGRILMEHLKELSLHSNLRGGDKLLYMTRLTWMMWNWLVSGLATKSTIMLYDGDPGGENVGRVMDFASREGCTHFGTSAAWLTAAQKAGVDPGDTKFDALRTVLSTGGPLSGAGFDYAGKFGDHVQVSPISGGGDICGCWVGGAPRPVYRGVMQMRTLGSNVQVRDNETGEVLSPGELGELVCDGEPPLSLPLGIMGDDEGCSRYMETYFERVFEDDDGEENRTRTPGTWWHHDLTEQTPEGGLVILGRSDETYKVNGVRVGPVDVYGPAKEMEEIADAFTVGFKKEGDDSTLVVLFVVTKPGVELDDALKQRINTKIRKDSTPAHIPKLTIAVPEIPRTHSGKIPVKAIKKTVNGKEVTNQHAFANPSALAHYADIPELRSLLGLNEESV